MKLPSLRKLNKHSWYLIIGLTMIMVVWAVVIVPGLGRLKSNTKAFIDTRDTQLTDSDTTANLINVVQHRAKLTENIIELQKLFIPKTNPLVYINRLEELANDAKVTIGINVKPPEDRQANAALSPTIINLTVDGDYQAVLTFLQSILHEPTVIQTQALDITTPSSTPGIISLDLTAITYWQ